MKFCFITSHVYPFLCKLSSKNCWSFKGINCVNFLDVDRSHTQVGESGASAQTSDRNVGVTNNGRDICTELLLEVDDALAQFDSIFLDLKKNQTARIQNAVQQLEKNEEEESNNAKLNLKNGESSKNSDIPNTREEKDEVKNNAVQEEMKTAGNRKTLKSNGHES